LKFAGVSNYEGEFIGVQSRNTQEIYMLFCLASNEIPNTLN